MRTPSKKVNPDCLGHHASICAEIFCNIPPNAAKTTRLPSAAKTIKHQSLRDARAFSQGARVGQAQHDVLQRVFTDKPCAVRQLDNASRRGRDVPALASGDDQDAAPERHIAPAPDADTHTRARLHLAAA